MHESAYNLVYIFTYEYVACRIQMNFCGQRFDKNHCLYSQPCIGYFFSEKCTISGNIHKDRPVLPRGIGQRIVYEIGCQIVRTCRRSIFVSVRESYSLAICMQSDRESDKESDIRKVKFFVFPVIRKLY
jgi:hypothetical protein